MFIFNIVLPTSANIIRVQICLVCLKLTTNSFDTRSIFGLNHKPKVVRQNNSIFATLFILMLLEMLNYKFLLRENMIDYLSTYHRKCLTINKRGLCSFSVL